MVVGGVYPYSQRDYFLCVGVHSSAMGESTCLLRSFSNPTDTSSIAKEGDPIRFLGESISFGRFMSESLAWEKWSAFSHNRYVEEAEKFSKPGSVAEKKAYFEAHYKKKAAEKAAALVQEANASLNATFDSETRDGNCNNSSMETTAKTDSNVTVIEQLEKDAVNYRVVDYADTNTNKCNIERSEVDNFKVERSEDVPQPLVDANLHVENCIPVDDSNQFHNVEVHEKIVVPKEERMTDPGTPGQVKGRKINFSPTLPTKVRASKPLYSLGERKTTVQTRSGISGAPQSKKSVGDSVEKRLSARSLHLSINLPSCVVETSKTASMLQQNRMKKIMSNLSNISRDCPFASQTSIRASNEVFNQTSANSQSEGRRTERPHNKSLSGGVTANAKLSFFSVECPISSSTSRSSPQSSTISSPFRFRSEERAANRKEFFRRMDEIKSKEVERVQLQRRCKEKTEHDQKKLRHSCGFKAKLNKDRNGGEQLPSNEMRKTSHAQSRSPKPGRKATSSACHGKNSQNSLKPPISTKTSKPVTEISNQTTRRSVTSLSKKITQENASPNIWR